jgi:signal transduction histidine kinase
MAFKIAARTILHLGGELISSDAVALYELIKNAFDAGSKEGVKIEVFVKLPSWPGIWPARLAELAEIPKDSSSLLERINLLKNDLIAAIDATAAGAAEFKQQIRAATSLDKLRSAIETANQIIISDAGHGMSKSDLTGIYLTIGTRYRREEKEHLVESGRGHERPILGEKGIGRLSVMRLGQKVRVKTTRSGETNWNVLEIDWSRFSHDSDALLEEISVDPKTGEAKDHRHEKGTTITISALNSRWAKANLIEFAGNEAAKFNSPFDEEKRYRVILRFNGEIIPIRDFDEMILNNCHAHVSVNFLIEDGKPHLRGRVDYRQHSRQRTFHLEAPQLTSVSGASINEIIGLGPFSMEVFWFNRRLLQKKEDGGVSISDVIKIWAGGLMLYRDGFRVLPYGNADDDWLDLDKKALASQGYKVNRQQLVGHVDISSIDNPALSDQTNREGLRESPEKNVLVKLLKSIIEVELRGFLNEVDGEERARLRLSFDELEERLTKEKTSIRKNLAELRKHRSETPHEQLLFKGIDDAVVSLEHLMEEAQALADEFERGRSQVIHLAGLGLMVEFLAHELNRATQHALGTLAENKSSNRPITPQTLQNLELQLKTLQKRLSTLDPATTSGRNRRERFDIALLAQQTIDGHMAEFKRHEISAPDVVVLPRQKPIEVLMVKGMVVQVLENLLSNSVYWLKQEQRLRNNFNAQIEVVIDTESRELRVTDNGPGVSKGDAEHIFKPFFTRKPPGEGKGLGLYISREIARYHKAELFLAEERHGHSKNRNTFVLTFPK